MKVLSDKYLTEPTGKLVPLPPSLKKYRVTWTDLECRKYDFGYLVSQIHIHDKYKVQFLNFEITEDTVIYLSWTEHVIALQCMVFGTARALLQGFDQEIVLRDNTFGMFYIPVSTNTVFLKPGSYLSIHFEMTPGYIEGIASAYPSINDLLKRFSIANSNGRPLPPANLHYEARHALDVMSQSTETNGMLEIEIQKCIYQMLSYYLRATRQSDKNNEPSAESREIVAHIYEEILQNPNIHTHTEKALERRFKIPASTLLNTFNEVYGERLSSFVRRHCMEKAMMLLTSTTRTIQDIAEELGYSDKSNFAKAFRGRYNMSPGEARVRVFG